MKYSYYVKDHGEGPDNAIEFLDSVVGWDEDDLGHLGASAAEYAWDNNDGWEWLNGSELTILMDGKELGTCYIDVESTPVFYARDINRRNK